ARGDEPGARRVARVPGACDCGPDPRRLAAGGAVLLHGPAAAGREGGGGSGRGGRGGEVAYLPATTSRSYTTSPSITVKSTFASGMRVGSISRMFSESTTRSPRLPGSSVPSSSSTNAP